MDILSTSLYDLIHFFFPKLSNGILMDCAYLIRTYLYECPLFFFYRPTIERFVLILLGRYTRGLREVYAQNLTVQTVWFYRDFYQTALTVFTIFFFFLTIKQYTNRGRNRNV